MNQIMDSFSYDPATGSRQSYYNESPGYNISDYAPQGGFQKSGYNDYNKWMQYEHSPSKGKGPRVVQPIDKTGFGQLNPYAPDYLQNIASMVQGGQAAAAQEKGVNGFNPFGGNFLNFGKNFNLHPYITPAAEVLASFIPGVGPLISAGIGATEGLTKKSETNYDTGEKGQRGDVVAGLLGGAQGYGLGNLTQGLAQGVQGLADAAQGAQGAGNSAFGSTGGIGEGFGQLPTASGALGTPGTSGVQAAFGGGGGSSVLGDLLGAGGGTGASVMGNFGVPGVSGALGQSDLSGMQAATGMSGDLGTISPPSLTIGESNAVSPAGTDVGPSSPLFTPELSTADRGSQLLQSLDPISSGAAQAAPTSNANPSFGSNLLDILFGTQDAFANQPSDTNAAQPSIPSLSPQEHAEQTSREPLNFSPGPSNFANNASFSAAPLNLEIPNSPQIPANPEPETKDISFQAPQQNPVQAPSPKPSDDALAIGDMGSLLGDLFGSNGSDSQQTPNFEGQLPPGIGREPTPNFEGQLPPGIMGAFNPSSTGIGGAGGAAQETAGAAGGSGAAPGAKQGGLSQNPNLSDLLGGGAGAFGAGPGNGGFSGGTGPGPQGPGQGPGDLMQKFQFPNQQQQQFQLPQFQPFSFPTSQIGGGSQFLSGDVGGLYGRLRKLLQLNQQNQMIQQPGNQATQIGQQAGEQSSSQGGQAGGMQ